MGFDEHFEGLRSEAIVFRDDAQRAAYISQLKRILDNIMRELQGYGMESAPIWDQLAQEAGVDYKYKAGECVHKALSWLNVLSKHYYEAVEAAASGGAEVSQLPERGEEHPKAAGLETDHKEIS